MRWRRTTCALWLCGSLAVTAATAGGAYRGTMSLDDAETEIVVRIDGPVVLIDVPDQGVEGAAASGVEGDGETLVFEFPELPGEPVFSGRWRHDGERLEGTVTVVAPTPPSTDVFLCELAAETPCAAPIAVTDRDGYDNQPYFLADGEGLLYTSDRDGQTDIFEYRLGDASTERRTRTPESEYSPTPTPDGEGFSTIRVEADGTQRLWSFPIAGGEPRLLLPEVAPVGYHAWLDDHTLALFVLGEPHTLRLARLGGEAPGVAAEDIGRSLHRHPADGWAAFVAKREEEWRITLLDPASGEQRVLGATLEGAEDFAILADGRLVMASGSLLYIGEAGDGAIAWSVVADLTEHGIDGVTRVAVSPDGSRLALVAARPAAVAPERSEGTFAIERIDGESDPAQ